MMKNNSLLFTILGGVVTCFVFVSMVFIFSSNETVKLDKKNSTTLLGQNNYIEEEEILLGDSCSQQKYDIVNKTYPTVTDRSACNYTLSGYTRQGCSTTEVSGSGGHAFNCTCTFYKTKTVCTECDPGKYLTDDKKCEACPSGKYCSGGTEEAKNCPTGWVPKSDQTGCQCAAGYGYGGASVGCTICPVGTHKSSVGNEACDKCDPGTYQDHTGQKFCKEPPAGAYQDQAGQSTYKQCDGTVNDAKTACTPAEPTPTPTPAISAPCCAVDSKGNSKTVTDATDCNRYAHDGLKVTSGACATTKYACYCNPTSSTCEWRNTNANNWEQMTNISTQAQCNAYSSGTSTGCFRTKDNKYVWGTYGNKEGYAMVSGATNKDTCETLNEGDPEGTTYGLSCPKTVIIVGQTIACTYSTSGSASLKGASSSNGAVASASASGNYVSIKGVKVGSASVYGTTSDGKKTNSVSIIVSESAVPEKCTISVSTGSIATSIDKDNKTINSYYTVNVTIAGKDCASQKATYTATNAKSVTPTSYSISKDHGTSTISTSFKVYPKDPCVASTATATLTNGSKGSVTISAGDIRTDWTSKSNVCVKAPSYTSSETADRAGANEYYTNYGKCTDGSTGYTVQWTRAACGGGGTTPPPTPQVPYCYLDNDGVYHWSTTAQASWKKIDTITKEEDCKGSESPACYLDPNGEYLWGKYAKKDGYTLVTSITDKDSCKKTEGDYACYKNDSGDYKWTNQAPDGYTKVTTAKSAVECAPPENEACYLHGNEYVWGKYSRVTGYIFIENITEKSACKAPETDACYKDSKGNYVWGKYGNDSKYTLVPSVTSKDQCKADVPVPKTAADVPKLVYVFMAILMACGIGFIYYSSVVKKTNQ